MRSFVLPVLARTAVLGAVSWILWSLADTVQASEEGFIWLLIVPLTLAGIAAVWAAVDGVLSTRRGAPVRIGSLVWLLVAVTTGLFQIVRVFVQDLVSGVGTHLWLPGQLRVALFYALLVGLPAELTLGLGRIAGRRTAPRARL